MIRKIQLIVAALIFAPMLLLANGAGTKGVDFINIGLGARPMAMGGAFYGLSDDLNAVQWNPAGLAGIRSFAIDSHYSALYEDLTYGGFSAGMPGPYGLSAGFSYFHLDSGSISRTIASNRGLYIADSGSFHVKHTLAIFSLANAHHHPFEFGMNFKRAGLVIDNTSSGVYLFDFGMLWNTNSFLRLGAGVQNIALNELEFLGEKERVARTTFGGAALRLLPERNVFLTADVKRIEDQDTAYAFGMEYLITKLKDPVPLAPTGFGFDAPRARRQESGPVRAPVLALRAGIRPTVADELGSGALPTMGVGFYFGNMRIDYAFVNSGELGLTHRASLGYSFGRNPWIALKAWNVDDRDYDTDQWNILRPRRAINK